VVGGIAVYGIRVLLGVRCLQGLLVCMYIPLLHLSC
jgi:hypothetical protein